MLEKILKRQQKTMEVLKNRCFGKKKKTLINCDWKKKEQRKKFLQEFKESTIERKKSAPKKILEKVDKGWLKKRQNRILKYKKNSEN